MGCAKFARRIHSKIPRETPRARRVTAIRTRRREVWSVRVTPDIGVMGAVLRVRPIIIVMGRGQSTRVREIVRRPCTARRRTIVRV